MSKREKFYKKLMSGKADTNIKFSELKSFLLYLGFKERIKGSHHIFTYKGAQGILTLQPSDDKIKVYQVEQVRIFLKKIGGTHNV